MASLKYVWGIKNIRFPHLFLLKFLPLRRFFRGSFPRLGFQKFYMKVEKEFHRIADFIAEYAVRLMGSGVHTSRVVRNTMRISEALGVVTQMTLLHKTIIFSIHDRESGEVFSDVVPVKSFPISFFLNSELSSLSWAALDNHLSLDEIERRYKKIVDTPRINHYLLTFLVACANGAFCQLFGGSWGAIGIVFVATVIGFSLKSFMQKRHISHYVVFVLTAFLSSVIASSALLFNATPDIAIGTSVLFLIPGVSLLNGVIDIVESHILLGTTRLVSALLLVMCIAVGLSITLAIVHNGLVLL